MTLRNDSGDLDAAFNQKYVLTLRVKASTNPGTLHQTDCVISAYSWWEICRCPVEPPKSVETNLKTCFNNRQSSNRSIYRPIHHQHRFHKMMKRIMQSAPAYLCRRMPQRHKPASTFFMTHFAHLEKKRRSLTFGSVTRTIAADVRGRHLNFTYLVRCLLSHNTQHCTSQNNTLHFFTYNITVITRVSTSYFKTLTLQKFQSQPNRILPNRNNNPSNRANRTAAAETNQPPRWNSNRRDVWWRWKLHVVVKRIFVRTYLL